MIILISSVVAFSLTTEFLFVCAIDAQLKGQLQTASTQTKPAYCTCAALRAPRWFQNLDFLLVRRGAEKPVRCGSSPGCSNWPSTERKKCLTELY